MFGDWVLITLFWWLEPIIILILVAIGDLSFGADDGTVDEEEAGDEIAAAEQAAGGLEDKVVSAVANPRIFDAHLLYEEDDH